VQGFQLTFYTTQGRSHQGQPLVRWLTERALEKGLWGATVIAAVKGLGHDGVMHSAHFFDLTDQPLQLTMILPESAAREFLDDLREQQVKVFYVLTAAEYGST